MARLPYDSSHVLLISERTSYLLHNLAIADVSDSTRYAMFPLEDGEYLPVRESDEDEFDIFKEIAAGFIHDILGVDLLQVSTIKSVNDAQFSGTAAAANVYLYSEYVPGGEAWEVDALWFKASTAVTTFQAVLTGEQASYLWRDNAPTPGMESFSQMRVALGEGARLLMAINGCTPGVTVYQCGFNYRVLPLAE